MKRSRGIRMKLGLAAAATTGLLLAGPELSCASAGASGLLASVDFCFLFNCNDGAIGGLVTFCSETDRNLLTGAPLDQPVPLFSDCR